VTDRPVLREVPVREAVGLRLAHDLTRIVPGEFKGVLFKKGHTVREEDIPALLDIGKEHIYVLELTAGWLHEDEAALRMARAVARGGTGFDMQGPSEGKVTLKSTIHGLFQVDPVYINQVNAVDEIAMATLRTNTVVQPGDSLLATRVIPLIVEEAKIRRIEEMADSRLSDRPAGPIVQVKPFRPLGIGLITTGSEVFSGRIEDRFGPVIRAKAEALGSRVLEQRFTSDDSASIVEHIRYFQEAGADAIFVTGGMSVDPDDRTPGAIRQAGAEVISQGTPMLPGSMLMVAYLDQIPVLGLPGSVMYHEFTAFDVLFPRICAGERIVRGDITEMGYGGLLSDKG